MKARFLCYDIRGIQSFIFSIPRLRYIVGASALIDEFDHETAPAHFGSIPNVSHIFSGGGRGAFLVEGEEAEDRLQRAVVSAAHEFGLDVRIGVGADYPAAVHGATRLFPFVPEVLKGEPCPESALYPTEEQVHPIVAMRQSARDRLGLEIMPRLRSAVEELGPIPDDLLDVEWEFPRNVDSGDPEGRAGAASFGGTGRWAIVAMDGNDMGLQHRAMASTDPADDVHYEWLGRMSRDLSACTRDSFVAALAKTVHSWAVDPHRKRAVQIDGKVFLPIRPLILGGDDIIVLSHARYAMQLAGDIATEFEARSTALAEAARADGIEHLWPATGDRLTISAGVLFTRFTYPLHTAITYAESLLASAKGRFRDSNREGCPAPAAVDWEHVTEGLLDTPAERRRRTLRFEDQDIGETIMLTARPYTFLSFEAKYRELLSDIGTRTPPRSLLHGVLPGLRTGFYGRFAYRARIEKNHPWLSEWLEEKEDGTVGKGWARKQSEDGKFERETFVPDVLALLEEGHRCGRQEDER